MGKKIFRHFSIEMNFKKSRNRFTNFLISPFAFLFLLLIAFPIVNFSIGILVFFFLISSYIPPWVWTLEIPYPIQSSACQCRRHWGHRFYSWIRKIPGRRKWQPTPAFLLESPLDRGIWQSAVSGVAKSWA